MNDPSQNLLVTGDEISLFLIGSVNDKMVSLTN